MSEKIKIGVAGANGKMGLTIIEEASKNPGFYQISSALVKNSSESPHNYTTDINDFLSAVDVIIDFTSVELTLDILQANKNHKKPVVIGTTGFTREQESLIKDSSKTFPIVFEYNMSIGVNLLSKLVELGAQKLKSNYDIEVLEMHHNKKVDSPSGTAIMLGRAAADGAELDFDKNKVLSRQGQVGKRKKGEIGFATLRGGGVIGEHSVIFASENDMIELKHQSFSRNIYAAGALKASAWLVNKKPCLYSMHDVLFS